jgi:hypothetical protein
MSQPLTLFQKIWNKHIVAQEPDSPAVLYIDLHLVHEVTSPQAFGGLRERGRGVRRPDKTVATVDHGIPTHDRSLPITDELAAKQIRQLEDNCREFGITLHGLSSPNQGIVHVIGPELGLTQPGMTIVCGDSHTATHGAFGALAFGIGTSEVEHVLATQCLLQRQPKTCEVRAEGKLAPGVSAKDIILALVAKTGIGGGTGHVFEYTGSAIRALSMEERMTVCNMSIEGGARAGYVNPDKTTFAYLRGRKYAPRGAAWAKALKRWRACASDADAVYDRLRKVEVTPWCPREVAAQPAIREFLRALFLTGNGAVIFGNSFVEWAASEAFRRARPSFVAAQFGVRSKPKPFTGVAVFDNPDKINPLPAVDDLPGSAVDAQMLALYVWLAASRLQEYQRQTACLCLAESPSEAYVVAPPEFPLWHEAEPVALDRLGAALRAWIA